MAQRCCHQGEDKVFTPQFWWGRLRRYQGPDPWLKPEKWDRLAQDYDDLETCSFYQGMLQEIISTLEKRGALIPQGRVLEIACGTGPYTLKMAPKVAEILAIDVSPRMLACLQKKAQRLGIKNLKVIEADWFSYQPEGRFHLTFAAMTPVLNFVETVERMFELSERFVALVHWAGLRENLLYREVHEAIFGRPPKPFRATVINHFNLFYSLGLAPECRLFKGLWVRKRPLEAEINHMLWRLEADGRLEEKDKEIVREILAQKADNGIIRTETKVRIGFVLVDKSA
ncbi:class I SAM-dependent methyltransferase [Thermosulfuriphilus sp.]